MKECTLPTGVLDVVWEPVHERVVDELGKEKTDGERGYALSHNTNKTYFIRQSLSIRQPLAAESSQSPTGMNNARHKVIG